MNGQAASLPQRWNVVLSFRHILASTRTVRHIEVDFLTSAGDSLLSGLGT